MGNKRYDKPRTSCTYPVRYWIVADQPPRDGHAANISPAGLFIATANHEKPGNPVTVDLAFPGPKVVRLRGRVAWARYQPKQFEWVHENGFGVTLSEAPEEWFEIILSLMRSNAEDLPDEDSDSGQSESDE